MKAIAEKDKLRGSLYRAIKNSLGPLNRAILTAIQTGNKDSLYKVIDEVNKTITNWSVVSHITGNKRAIVNTTKNLSAFSNAVSALEKQFALSEEQIIELEAIYSKRALSLTGDLLNAAEKVVRDTTLEITSAGLNVKDATTLLAQNLKNSGIGGKSYLAETWARTSTNQAYSAGRWQQAKDPDIADLIWGYEYVAINDDRVRDSHAALDGVRKPKDDPFWNIYWPPNGWNCRCDVLEIISDTPEAFATSAPGIMPDEGFAFNAGKIIDFNPLENMKPLEKPKPKPKPKKEKAPVKPKEEVPQDKPIEVKPMEPVQAKPLNPPTPKQDKELTKTEKLRIQLEEAKKKRLEAEEAAKKAQESLAKKKEEIGKVKPKDEKKPIIPKVNGDEDSIKKSEKEFKRIFKENKGLSDRAKDISATIDVNEKRAGRNGSYFPGSKTIKINPKLPKVKDEIELGNFLVSKKETYTSVLRHEYGHAVFEQGLTTAEKQAWNELYASRSKKEWSKTVSKYGSSDPHELFSEAFSAKTSGQSIKLPDEIEQFMNLILK